MQWWEAFQKQGMLEIAVVAAGFICPSSRGCREIKLQENKGRNSVASRHFPSFTYAAVM